MLNCYSIIVNRIALAVSKYMISLGFQYDEDILSHTLNTKTISFQLLPKYIKLVCESLRPFHMICSGSILDVSPCIASQIYWLIQDLCDSRTRSQSWRLKESQITTQAAETLTRFSYTKGTLFNPSVGSLGHSSFNNLQISTNVFLSVWKTT